MDTIDEEQSVNEPLVPEVKVKVKKTRTPTAYNNFVKETYSTLTDIPTNQRFSKCSELWRQKKEQMKLDAEKAKQEAENPKPKAKAKPRKKPVKKQNK